MSWCPESGAMDLRTPAGRKIIHDPTNLLNFPPRFLSTEWGQAKFCMDTCDRLSRYQDHLARTENSMIHLDKLSEIFQVDLLPATIACR
jgi:hypothetical protein